VVRRDFLCLAAVFWGRDLATGFALAGCDVDFDEGWSALWV
jgi:hypothetical protein